jgi:hypothetical protein
MLCADVDLEDLDGDEPERGLDPVQLRRLLAALENRPHRLTVAQWAELLLVVCPDEYASRGPPPPASTTGRRQRVEALEVWGPRRATGCRTPPPARDPVKAHALV